MRKGKMTKARGGKQYHGEAIGIAIVDGFRYAMPPGDVGNASTYDFPVGIKALKGLCSAPRRTPNDLVCGLLCCAGDNRVHKMRPG
jgi:hypothetical protein